MIEVPSIHIWNMNPDHRLRWTAITVKIYKAFILGDFHHNSDYECGVSARRSSSSESFSRYSRGYKFLFYVRNYFELKMFHDQKCFVPMEKHFRVKIDVGLIKGCGYILKSFFFLAQQSD